MRKLTYALTTLAITGLAATPALAGEISTPISEPGILGLVAGGVVAAILLSRMRGK